MNKNKELTVISVGIFLIILVAIFTFFRTDDKSTDVETSKNENASGLENKAVSPLTLQEKIKNGEKLKIIDLRNFEQYSTEHILDSINVPFEELTSREINTEEEIILFTEPSSNQEAVLSESINALKEKGATNITILDSDIEQWKTFGGQTVTYGDPTKFYDQSKVSYISQDELKSKLDGNEPLLIIDVREKEKFESGHLPKAINISLPDIEKRRSEISLSTLVIVYSDMETEAFQASVRIYEMKFITSAILKEGYSKWTASNFPIEK